MRKDTFSTAEGRHHDGLYGVDPVFGFVENDRGARLEDLFGDLHGTQPEFLLNILAHELQTQGGLKVSQEHVFKAVEAGSS